MKKVFAILLALSLVLMMGTTAFAANTGVITIKNAAKEADYSIYQMLNFTASNAEGNKGIYTIVTGWEDFFNNNVAAQAAFVVTNGDQTTVVLKETVTAVDQALAKEAIKYAQTKGITAIETKKANGSTVEFTNLPLGYYAIDTSLGTLCALTNTNSTFTATEKNEKPDITKQVKEDSTGAWGLVNDDDIGKTINYQSVITIGVGGTQYVMHDTMDAGLTFDENSVAVTLNDVAVDKANYTVNDNPGDGHTFDIIFDNDYIAGLAKSTQLVVTYSATLNNNAVIAGEGNKNTAFLSYGESTDLKTGDRTTTTYTWQMDVFKFTQEGENKVGLPNAKFQLLLGATPLKFTKVDSTETPTYRYDANGTIDTITTDTTGKFIILGLDADNYDLDETKAPAGYNELADSVDVNIVSTANDEATALTYTINNLAPATIEVENKTGGLFPETGGIGTTIFYVVGALLMISAAVILISKKRMNGYV